MSQAAPEALRGRPQRVPKRSYAELEKGADIPGWDYDDDEDDVEEADDERPAKRVKREGPPPVGRSTGKPLLGNAEFDRRFRALGGRFDVSSGPVHALPHVDGHRDGFFADIAGRLPHDYEAVLGRFGTFYRSGVAPGMDEILPTSAVREYMRGYFENLPSDPGARANAAILFENISKLSRFPTHVIGYATATPTEVMQHPTGRDKGVFKTGGGNLHNALDRERKQVALEAGEEEAKNPAATKKSVLEAMLRAAAVFTLNYMAAPASASDVRPFGLRTSYRTYDDPKIRKWVGVRERIKDLAIALGATFAPDIADQTGRGRAEHPWQEAGKDMRRVSPSRLRGKGGKVKLFKDPPGTAPAGPLASPPPELFPPPTAVTTQTFPPEAAVAAPDPIAHAAGPPPGAAKAMELEDLFDLI